MIVDGSGIMNFLKSMLQGSLISDFSVRTPKGKKIDNVGTKLGLVVGSVVEIYNPPIGKAIKAVGVAVDLATPDDEVQL